MEKEEHIWKKVLQPEFLCKYYLQGYCLSLHAKTGTMTVQICFGTCSQFKEIKNESERVNYKIPSKW